MKAGPLNKRIRIERREFERTWPACGPGPHPEHRRPERGDQAPDRGQLHRHRCTGTARRIAGGGQDLRRGVGGAGRGRAAGDRRPAAGASGPGPRAPGRGAERSADAQAGKQLPARTEAGWPADGQRRRCRPAAL
ncbi:hypothetical protein G6F63_013984 [Rhizopus arrhizus]|nr:hypothetical protein G6F63_013984 [Rhizopus arrhizus]